MTGVDEYLGVLAADADDVVTLVRERAQLAVSIATTTISWAYGSHGPSGRSAAGS